MRIGRLVVSLQSRDEARADKIRDASQDLFDALLNIMTVWPNHGKVPGWCNRWINAQEQARTALKKATE